MRISLCFLALSFLALPLEAEKKIIVPAEFAPAAGANAPMFSPGILVDGTLYISGQLGTDLKTQQIPAEFEQEVKASLANIGIILKAAGMGYEDVVSVQVYLSDMDLFPRMNAVYSGVFKAPRPTRSTVGVSKLARPNARIEITVTAHK